MRKSVDVPEILVKLLKNAMIMPLLGTMDAFAGGLFSSDGQFVEGSLLERGKPARLEEPVEYLDGCYIYGGCLFSHFGHFIWESLSRLYAVRQCNTYLRQSYNYPILFISPNTKIFGAQKRFFRAMGVKSDIVLIKKAVRVGRLVYSPAGSSIDPLFMADAQLAALQSFTFLKAEEGQKIWLSRSRLGRGRITNEESLEAELRQLGYEIVYPEELPLKSQARLVSTASVVAGFDGSQFFSLLFAAEVKGKFFIFNRRKDIAPTIPYMLEKRKVEFSLHYLDIEHVDGEGAAMNHRHCELDRIVELLQHQ